MKKIGILTFYYNNSNYGGLLQAYALQKYVASLGVQAEQICYDFQTYRKKSFKDYIRSLIKKLIRDNNNIDEIFNLNIESRNRKFKDFEKAIPHSKTVYHYQSIKDANSEYDFFICGSDQIWNDWGLRDDVVKNFALDFVHSKNKMSYAASFGSSSISDYHKDLLRKNILELSCVTVREENGLAILEKMNRMDGKVVVDPVFLLSRGDWAAIAEEAVGLPDDYACLYFLGDLNEKCEYIYRFFKTRKIETVMFPHINHYKKDDEAHTGFDCYGGPSEFIGAIKKSKLVLTDSFHAMVFSLIFNKEFYVIERDTLIKGNSMSSRITSLLKKLDLSERLISVEDINVIDLDCCIDYEKVNCKLNEMINDSKDILLSCIEE